MAKKYPANQSPLYRLVGIGQLKRVLSIDTKRLEKILSQENYRTWHNEKGREIQQPIKWLAQVHKRIGELLSRIEVPDYVYSQKGRSYADNARQHLGNVPLAKTDISKFYPSTTRHMVWRMFVADFKCACDVADILADICCYQQKHLPTGSSLSGRVAFFAARHMFDEISDKAQAIESKLTVYVDDITLSGHLVTKKVISEVRHIVRVHGLQTKESKTKTYASGAAKMVTGAVLVGNEMRLPNSRHKKIWEAHRAMQLAKPEDREKFARSLKGRLQEAKQIISGSASSNLTKDGKVSLE